MTGSRTGSESLGAVGSLSPHGAGSPSCWRWPQAGLPGKRGDVKVVEQGIIPHSLLLVPFREQEVVGEAGTS